MASQTSRLYWNIKNINDNKEYGKNKYSRNIDIRYEFHLTVTYTV